MPRARTSSLARLFAAVALLGAPVAPTVAQVTIDWVQPTEGVSIAVDGADNVYTVYYVYALGAEMILTKRDPAGTLLWEARYDQTDSTKWERAAWVVTDSDGNAVVCGTSMSGYSNPVEAASIAMKFDPDGNLLWRRVYESSFDGSYVRKCLVDADDNVYVLGMGAGPNGYVTKIKKFAPDGTEIWSYFDAAGVGAPINFKLTPDGYLVVAARSIYGSINGYAKVGLDGAEAWSYPGVNSLTVGDADGDELGNTYLVHGEYVINGGTVVKKLDQGGSLVWERTFGLSGLRIEVGSDRRAVVSGFPNAGSGGAAFVKIDETGDLVWSNLDADGPDALLLHAHMILGTDDSAYLAAGTLFEMAVCKVTSDGASAWVQKVQGGYATAIALGNGGRSVFVVGGTTARLTEDLPGAPPQAPTALHALLVTSTSADLAWTDNASDESGFALERCDGTRALCEAEPSRFAPLATAPAGATTYTDATLTPGTSYCYRVSAFNGAGASGFSNVLDVVTPTAPAAPSNLRAQPRLQGTRGRVKLAWRDNASNETGYTVERCVGSGCADFAPIAYLGADTTSHTDTTVARGTTYRYRVMATSPAGSSAYSNVATAAVP